MNTQRGSVASVTPSDPVSRSLLPAKRSSLQRQSVLQDRPVNASRGAEVSFQAWAFLFSEIIQYTQQRVTGVADFEKKLSVLGYRVGSRLVELLPLRDSLPPSTSRNATGPPRFVRLLPVLHYIHTPLYRYLFGKAADALERSTEADDEYMVIDNDPLITRGIDVPQEMSSLSCVALTAGVVEAVLDGWAFVRVCGVLLLRPTLEIGQPARVTAHAVPLDGMPRRTVLLIKLDKDVIDREAALGPAR